MPGRRGRLERQWYSAVPPSFGLRALATLHGGVLALRRALYARGLFASRRASVPVVVVGNLTAGGTGKTPVTAFLAERLVAGGATPGIASRGFGRSTRGLRDVEADDDPARVGDEPLMLRRQTGVPVCVAERRIEAVDRLTARGCNVVVCDDGLQHLALRRDFEIAVVDASRGLGNGRLLPAGPLRETADRLRSVDAIVVNGTGGAADALLPPGVRALPMQLQAQRLDPLAGGAPLPLEWLQGRTVRAVAGIGHPERFFGLLESLGARVLPHALPDHHAFVADDIRFADDLPVILTAKDAVKCAVFADARHHVLTVRAHFAPADETWLVERIRALVGTEGLRRD